MNKGVISAGEHCNAQGSYHKCILLDEVCPYIRNNENRQNECPHNLLKLEKLTIKLKEK